LRSWGIVKKRLKYREDKRSVEIISSSQKTLSESIHTETGRLQPLILFQMSFIEADDLKSDQNHRFVGAV
jgi:hypothetical protein